MLRCFDKLNQRSDELVINLARNNEYITRRDVIETLRIKQSQASYLLKKLKQEGRLESVIVKGRKAGYRLSRQLTILN